MRQTLLRGPLAALAAAVLIAASGCSQSPPADGGAPTDPSPASTTGADALGTYGVTGASEGQEQLDWTRSLTLALVTRDSETRLHVSGACNFLDFALVDTGADSWSALPDPAMTYAGCIGEAETRQTWLLDAIGGATIEVAGPDLRVTSRETRIDAAACATGEVSEETAPSCADGGTASAQAPASEPGSDAP